MSSLLVFLATALTAIIGPWVDAPPMLTTLSGAVALFVGWFSMAIMQSRLRQKAAPVTATDGNTAHTPTLDGPEIIVNQDAAPVSPARDSRQESPADPSLASLSMVQSRLQLESMRVQALEGELKEFRQRNDQLMRERVDLMRAAADASRDSQPSAATTARDASRARSEEAALEIRLRDEWITGQRGAIDEFRSGIAQVELSLEKALKHIDAASPVQISDDSAQERAMEQFQSQLTSLAGTLAAAGQIAPGPAVTGGFDVPSSMDNAISAIVSTQNRLQEIVEHARITSINARILRDRPGDPEVAELLESIATETAVLASNVEKIHATFAPTGLEVENLRREIEHTRSAIANESSNLAGYSQMISRHFADIDAYLQDCVSSIKATVAEVAVSTRDQRTRLARSQAAIDAVVDALNSASGVARLLAMSVERLSEGSKIATTGMHAFRTQQATSMGG